MSRYENRTRGTVVHLLDPQKTAEFLKNRLDRDVTPTPMVVVNGPDGLATVVSEGVGWMADSNGMLPIDYNGGYLDVYPEEVKPLISNKTIDLADFVRVFGDRLENNLSIWQNYTKGYDQSMSEALATMEAN